MNYEKLMQNNLKDYISNIYNVYKNSSKNKSISDTLIQFSQLAQNYETKNINFPSYSSNDFYKCTNDEQQNFINDQLQLVESLVLNTIYGNQGIIWNFEQILNLIIDKDYSLIDKASRKVVFPCSSSNRPTGEISYDIWNGIQIIDLDIKNAELANKLKPLIFEKLSRYKWFLAIYLSASKKSLHIWTKIQPLTIEHEHRKIEYLCNFRQKYSYIYIVLLNLSEKLGYTKEDIVKFIDFAMCKPQQGIFIASDPYPLINTNFYDLRLDVNFESALNNGIESINWISHPDLKEIFKKLEWFGNDIVSEPVNLDKLSNLQDRDISKNKKIHYKHNQRWQLANTLVALYGEQNGFIFMKEICSGTPDTELRGDVKTAAIHNKPISLWAVNTLNKYHGFKIKLAEETINNKVEEIKQKIEQQKDNSIDPTRILNDSTNIVDLYLKSNQYLSDIKNDILANLSNITLLEAGAGYGKTEMIKSLKDRTLLILPFTSTIKAKVEADSKTSDWLYYYGNKRPTLQEILGDKNMSMTIDKFSRLNLVELDQANFKYIVIDESHLLYTSSYRDVMAPTIQRLANCSNTKVIMMTGTPTGEVLFFPNIKHIKVTKEDNRIKKFDVFICNKKIDKIVQMADYMAQDLIDGKKILYPSNDGNLFYEQIIGLIQERFNEKCLANNMPIRKIKSFYYKKSNYGDQSMEDINIDKSIGTNDIICCSNYLSVGVDICDKYNFTIYFSKLWIAQDIEQFANRIRNNDLYIKLFLERCTNDGIIIDYNITRQLDLTFSQPELLLAHDLIQICNDMLERNNEESKYNPMISSLLSTNRYLKYDENEFKYFIDETTYKLKIFEDRYSEYSTQLNVIMSGMKYYGYETQINTINTNIPDNEIEEAEQLFKNYRTKYYNEQTIKTFKFLNHINDDNIESYKDILKGAYNIFKDDKYKETREKNNLYVEDVEVVLKNLPIYIKLYKFYDPETIIDIYKFCVNKKNNRINFSQLDRIKRFVTIEDNRRKKRIDFPVYKFILDAQKFAKENEYVEANKIIEWIANYSARIANIVKNVAIDDKEFLESIYDLTKELFNIVVVKGQTKRGIVHIEPFELLWERKTSLFDLYGGSIYTKEFFVNELIDNMKSNIDDEYEKQQIINVELPHTEKVTLEQIVNDLPNVIHSKYDYYDYSTEDGSNDRFMRKQENTSHLNDFKKQEEQLEHQLKNNNDLFLFDFETK